MSVAKSVVLSVFSFTLGFGAIAAPVERSYECDVSGLNRRIQKSPLGKARLSFFSRNLTSSTVQTAKLVFDDYEIVRRGTDLSGTLTDIKLAAGTPLYMENAKFHGEKINTMNVVFAPVAEAIDWSVIPENLCWITPHVEITFPRLTVPPAKNFIANVQVGNRSYTRPTEACLLKINSVLKWITPLTLTCKQK